MNLKINNKLLAPDDLTALLLNFPEEDLRGLTTGQGTLYDINDAVTTEYAEIDDVLINTLTVILGVNGLFCLLFPKTLSEVQLLQTLWQCSDLDFQKKAKKIGNFLGEYLVINGAPVSYFLDRSDYKVLIFPKVLIHPSFQYLFEKENPSLSTEQAQEILQTIPLE